MVPRQAPKTEKYEFSKVFFEMDFNYKRKNSYVKEKLRERLKEANKYKETHVNREKKERQREREKERWEKERKK